MEDQIQFYFGILLSDESYYYIKSKLTKPSYMSITSGGYSLNATLKEYEEIILPYLQENNPGALGQMTKVHPADRMKEWKKEFKNGS